MSTPTAIFAGLALIVTAIYLGNGKPALSQSGSGFGPWNMKDVKSNEIVWKLNSATGDLFRCAEKQCTKMEGQ
jgi:hypothetical protein